MNLLKPQFASLLCAAALLWSASVVAQANESGQSLVLALNILSDTHARPATGVVVAQSGAGEALVVVAADFVSAGDEIVVLDGGADLLRNGRATRTVARAAELGVAVLEVEGFQRSGVTLSADALPVSGSMRFEHAAWPAAEALVEGAPLQRQDLSVAVGEGGALTLSGDAPPSVSGPLFDSCGNLAGFYLAGEQPAVAGAGQIAQALGTAGLDVQRRSCTGGAGTGDEEPQAATATDESEAPEPAVNPADESAGDEADESWSATDEVLQTSAQGSGDTVLMAVLLVLAAAAIFFRFYRGGSGSEVILAGGVAGQRHTKHKLSFGPEKNRDRLKQGELGITFEVRDGRVLAWDTSEDDGRLSVFVNDTPCFHGERFFVEGGQEIRLGAASYQVSVDLARGKE